MEKLDQALVAKSGWGKASIGPMQVAIYVMCGGGFLGRSAAEQPGDFSIDSRVGRLPYSDAKIMQAVQTLVTIAGVNGLDPKHMPTMPDFHCLGVF